MHYFHYQGTDLYCEGVSVAKLMAEAGSPLYIYSAKTLREQYGAITEAFAGVDTTICFSVKSCSSLGVLKVLCDAGAAFDIVSGGELYRVLQAGGDAARVVYAGVGKTATEIRFALESGIMLFNVESEAELAAIDRIAGAMGVTAPIGLRINPDVDAKTHAKTTTGKKENKFGIPFEAAGALLRDAGRFPHCRFKALDVHLGSPINDPTVYGLGLARVAEFLERFEDKSASVEFIDVGGGFGLLYNEEATPPFARYAEAIVPAIQRLGRKLLLEPGRSIAGNAGILAATVQYIKKSDPKTFAIIDAGMSMLLRPAMYDAFHALWPVQTECSPASALPLLADKASPEQREGELIPTDVVGPICESSDVFCKDRPLPRLAAGDGMAIFSAGAYGFAMSSQYNSHPRPAEVLVDGESWRVIRQRETYADLLAGETT